MNHGRDASIGRPSVRTANRSAVSARAVPWTSARNVLCLTTAASRRGLEYRPSLRMNLPPAARVRALYTRPTSYGSTPGTTHQGIIFTRCIRVCSVRGGYGRQPAAPRPPVALFLSFRGRLGRAAAPPLGRAQRAAFARPFERPLGVEFGPFLGDQIVAPAGFLA